MNIPDYLWYSAAWFYPRILVGPGAFLTQRFAAENDIRFVLNCAFDYDSPDWFQERFPERYVCLNAVDSETVNILDWYPAFEAAMQRFLRESHGTVYVHCHAGKNRSGSLALAYVCQHFQLPLEGVIAATRSQRPVLFQNPVFMNQVQDFINNGRLSSQKNTRLDVDRVHDRDSGLSSSGDHQGSPGDKDNAGESPAGTGQSVSADLGTVRTE